METLNIYREKDVVEKAFDGLKNDLDMKRLRVQSPKRMNSRMFIQFIALILISRIRRTLSRELPDSKWTVKGLLMELESLTTIHYSKKYRPKLSKVVKKLREILEAFGIKINNML